MLERRILPAGIAATMAAPALAQTAGKERTNDASKDSSMSQTTGAGTGTMGDAEQKHMTDTMAVGSMSLLASRVAVKKVRDDDIKEFAEFEVAEQETIADVLMSMMDPSKATGKSNPPSESEARKHVPQDQQATLQKMEQMEGKEFETAYVRAQTEGHQKLLRIQETYLASGKDPAHINVAKLARGQIKEHLQLLADLHDDDDKNATTGRSSRVKK
ncbi:putative membrane protein [Bradyrhizobium sp. LB1.3]